MTDERITSPDDGSPVDEARLALKNARGECFVWWCDQADPKFPVVWKCPAGHRTTIWYCPEHGPGMTALALQAAAEEAGPACPDCPGDVLMTPVTDTVIL